MRGFFLMQRKEFVRQFAEYILKGRASVFIGAGLSMAAGYPSWRELLRDIATEIGLNVDVESDLAAVAQYYLNRKSRNRSLIAQVIREKFPPATLIPETIRVV